MDISILIVNYNSSDLAIKCIDSILVQTGIEFEIIVIDNASPNDNLTLFEPYSNKIKLILNQTNIGFGRANNQAAVEASGKYLLLLNPDAQLSHSNDLAQLTEFMEKNLDVGLVSTRILNEKNQETLPKNNYPGERYIDSPFKQLPGKIAWVLGACMCVKRELFLSIDGFDKDYFLYGEDTDLCLRLRKKGWPIVHANHITVRHVGRGSERKSTSKELWQKKQNGLHLFLHKHYSLPSIKVILQRHRQQAQWRLLNLNFKKLFRKLSLKEQNKLIRFRVVNETSRDLEKIL